MFYLIFKYLNHMIHKLRFMNTGSAAHQSTIANFRRQLSQHPLLLSLNYLLLFLPFLPSSPKEVFSYEPWISFCITTVVDGHSWLIVFQMKLCLKESPPNLRIKMNKSFVSIKLNDLPPPTFRHSVKILSRWITFECIRVKQSNFLVVLRRRFRPGSLLASANVFFLHCNISSTFKARVFPHWGWFNSQWSKTLCVSSLLCWIMARWYTLHSQLVMQTQALYI